MNNFRKVSLILGGVFLFTYVATWVINTCYYKFDVEHHDVIDIIWVIISILWSLCLPILFIYNAVKCKSSTAIIAAIFGVLSFLVGNVLGYFYFIPYCGLLAILLSIISIGFFADSRRNNKAVQATSIILMVITFVQFILYICGVDLLYNPTLLSVIADVVIYLLPTCALFVAASTIKEENKSLTKQITLKL